MDRQYANAKKVLPPELLRSVQGHFTGLLWVPSTTSAHHKRRMLVLALKDQGTSTREIARLSGITRRRVRQIVRETREE
jgi:predicted transcriptional regulator